MTEQNLKTKEPEAKEIPVFKGKYLQAVGRRKRAIAEIRLYQHGKGFIMVNGSRSGEYFSTADNLLVQQPLKLSGHLKDFNFSVNVHGGGKHGQAEAVRHGIARALLLVNSELRPALKTKDLLTRDSRKVERKKAGLKKARRAPQWSKR